MSVRQTRVALGRVASTAFSGSTPVKAAKIWIAFGACTGGFYSGGIKLDEICKETTPEYKYPEFEGPVHYVYNASRVAGHAGWGAAIGGSAAATAPISMPAYYFYMQQQVTCATKQDNQ